MSTSQNSGLTVRKEDGKTYIYNRDGDIVALYPYHEQAETHIYLVNHGYHLAMENMDKTIDTIKEIHDDLLMDMEEIVYDIKDIQDRVSRNVDSKLGQLSEIEIPEHSDKGEEAPEQPSGNSIFTSGEIECDFMTEECKEDFFSTYLALEKHCYILVYNIYRSSWWVENTINQSKLGPFTSLKYVKKHSELLHIFSE